jgi:hypothetical protein
VQREGALPPRYKPRAQRRGTLHGLLNLRREVNAGSRAPQGNTLVLISTELPGIFISTEH